MYQLVLILKILHQLEKLDLSWDEVRHLGTNVFELDMFTAAVKISRFLGPPRIAMLWLVFILTLGDHHLKSIGLIVTELNADLFFRLLESLADRVTLQHVSIERFREADCSFIKD